MSSLGLLSFPVHAEHGMLLLLGVLKLVQCSSKSFAQAA